MFKRARFWVSTTFGSSLFALMILLAAWVAFFW